MLAWIQANMGMVLGVLFAISEALALIPGVQSNSVFQLIYNTLKGLVVKTPPAP
jgi:hypothetical protein